MDAINCHHRYKGATFLGFWNLLEDLGLSIDEAVVLWAPSHSIGIGGDACQI